MASIVDKSFINFGKSFADNGATAAAVAIVVVVVVAMPIDYLGDPAEKVALSKAIAKVKANPSMVTKILGRELKAEEIAKVEKLANAR